MPTKPPARPRLVAIAVSAVIVVGTTSVVVGSEAAPARADAADDLAAARDAVDEIAERWFEAQSVADDLAAQIDELEVELRAIRHRTRSVRRTAHQQAVNLYQGAASGTVTSFLDGTTAMDAARRSELLASVNARTRDDLDRYTKLVHDTRDRLDELDARRAEQERVLTQLGADEAAMQRELARAQQAYRAEQAAIQAAEAAAAAEPDDPGTGSTDPPDSTDPGNAPDPTSDPGTDPGSGPDPVDPPPPPPGQHPRHDDPFLSCVRQRESRGIYTAVNSGGYYGAYQFAIGTWDATASHAGRPELIGVRPDRAAPWDQDDLAWVLYQWQGMDPWGGGCG